MSLQLIKTRWCGVIRMITRRSYLLMLLLVLGCQQAIIGQNNASVPSNGKAVQGPRLSQQLKINRDVLLNKGSSEQMRIDAATLMLFSKEEPAARNVLVEVLKQSENKAARSAVCKALTLARVNKKDKQITNKGDFIQPLFGLLTGPDTELAQLAAESLLIFDYNEISEQLDKIVKDRSVPPQARLNVIHALQLQPTMGATFKLMELLDDPQPQVADAAEQALRAVGIAVSKDPAVRQQIKEELKNKGPDGFLRDVLIRKEERIRALETERNLWQGLYIGALDKLFNYLDDTGKGKFLAENLASSQVSVKLWALQKAYEQRLAVGPKAAFSSQVGPVLITLISDQDRTVRLKAARLLALLDKLNSAEPLLARLQNEQDPEVRAELFVALGWACYYACSPDSPFKLAPQVRTETLKLAEAYLAMKEPDMARRGAQVIKRLLERDGLATEEVDRYLGLLVQRYQQEKGNGNGMLRAELVGVMAGLCGQGVYKVRAAQLFAPVFEEALGDKEPLVREAAVDGFIYIDKATALAKLRTGFVNDSSPRVRQKLINLAAEVGTAQDLDWLYEKLGSTEEGGLAWQAMLKIFRGSDVAVLKQWVGRFGSAGGNGRLTDEQLISFLVVAERKAEAEQDAEMLESVREKLADAYIRTADYEQAAKCLGSLRQASTTTEQKRAISDKLLTVYLQWPNIARAIPLVKNTLAEYDPQPDSEFFKAIEQYLANPPAGADAAALLKQLSEIKTPQDRPNWQKHLQQWLQQYAPPKSPTEPNVPATPPAD